mgnify:CR=1 FL=1
MIKNNTTGIDAYDTGYALGEFMGSFYILELY